MRKNDRVYVPILTINYDGTNFISLTSKDKHFNYFVKKVKEVYLKEKDTPLKGFFAPRYINEDYYLEYLNHLMFLYIGVVHTEEQLRNL